MNKKYLYLSIILSIFLKQDPNFRAEEKYVLTTYGENDLAEIKDFQGGYINFGYWKNISFDKEISVSQRIQSSKDLYTLIFNTLEINENDEVLEVGCGRGNGCIDFLNMTVSEKICGVDIAPQQIYRAQSIHQDILQKFPQLSFKISSSSHLDFADNSFTKIYSVEAAQCFPSIEKFAIESYRLLKDNGIISITAHFSTNQEGYKNVQKFIPTFDKGDRLIPISQVREAFKNAGFTEIKFFSIGKYVFKGLDQWLEQISAATWVRNFYECYNQGYLDYYVLVFRKV